MAFTKEFFDGISALIDKYYARFPACATFTLTIRVSGKDYHVNQVLDKGEHLVALVYYEPKKTLPGERSKFRDMVFPLLVVPYAAIEWIEFNPAGVLPGQIGFSPRHE